MGRLVDTEAVYNEIKKTTDKFGIFKDTIEKSLWLMLGNVPTAEERRQKGEWIKVYESEFGITYKCSLCGRIILVNSVDNKKLNDYPYCHCGALMGGFENE